MGEIGGWQKKSRVAGVLSVRRAGSETRGRGQGTVLTPQFWRGGKTEESGMQTCPPLRVFQSGLGQGQACILEIGSILRNLPRESRSWK